MDKKLKEIIFGCLLGDASLQTYTSGRTWRLRFIQGDSQKEYLFYKYDLFKEFVKTPPKSIVDSSGNTRWYFNTVVLPELIEFGELFYNKKVKVLPSYTKISEYLTPLAISFWYMDDGSKKSNSLAYYLCTDCFTLDQVKLLGEVLFKNYGIQVSYHKQRESYRIYIPTRHYLQFHNLILPHVHPSMLYKL